MPRRRTENSISMFPFLAVLVCTMGALILLLLVTTRRIRNEQTVRLVQETATQKSDDDPVSNDALSHMSPGSTAFVIADAAFRTASVTHEFRPVLFPPRSAKSIQQDHEAAQIRIAELQSGIAEEQQHHSQLQSAIAEIEAKLKKRVNRSTTRRNQKLQLAELKMQQDTLKRKLQHKQRELQRLVADLDEQSTLTEGGETVLRKRESALVSLRRIAAQQKEPDGDVRSNTVIEFTNATGTQRSPIIVDVRDAGFRLVPSGVMITREDMEGFPANDNPLLSVILAVHDARHPITVSVRPYVLLLVRPSGSMAFYVAQRTLTDAGVHFGYELLDDDRHVKVKQGTADEAAVAQKALETALQRRNQLYGGMLAKIDSLKRSAKIQAGSSGRRARVLPDGRIVELTESNSDNSAGRYYAGGEAPPPKKDDFSYWESPQSDRSSPSGETDASHAPGESLFESMKTKDNQSSETVEDFPPLIRQNEEAQRNASNEPIIIAGPRLDGSPAVSNGKRTEIEQENAYRQSMPSRKVPETGGATFLPAKGTADRDTQKSDRTGPQRSSGWSNPGSADPRSTTRTAGTAEAPSVFGTPDAGAFPQESSSPRQSGQPQAAQVQTPSDSQRFLQQFLKSVADQKYESEPDPFLLAILKNAEAGPEKQQNTNSNSKRKTDAAISDEADQDRSVPGEDGSRTPRQQIRITLRSDSLKVGSGEQIGTAGWRSNRLFAAILDGLSRELRHDTRPMNSDRLPTVVFVTVSDMRGTQQHLSERLKELQIATTSVTVLPTQESLNDEQWPVIGDESKQEPAAPAESSESGTAGRRSI